MVKLKGGGVSLVVGEDLRVSQIKELDGRTVLGKLSGRGVSMSDLNSWMQHEWAPLLGYGPVTHLLAQWWIGFIFKTKDDVRMILLGCWYWD